MKITSCIMMCGRDAICIDKKTKEPLCESCAAVSEQIYRNRGEVGEYKKI